jgi:hypothetical protein
MKSTSRVLRALRNVGRFVPTLVVGALVPVGAALAADAAPVLQPAEPGVWQKHQYSFNFMGFTTTYSCDGLEDKLRLLLLAAGARKDAKTSSGGCSAPFGRPDKFASADLTFYALRPEGSAPPANPSPPARGKPPKGKPEPVTLGRGVWRTVVFSARSPRELGIGDCELVEQFRDNVLPLLTTRNVEDHTSCIPHQDSGSNIDLRFEVFAAAPGGPEVLAAAGPPGSS